MPIHKKPAKNTDVMSLLRRSELMSRIKGKNTKPELALRHAVWALGLRYRLHRKIDRSRPDLVFAGVRLAVFVDGCFWHCCPKHGVQPKSNAVFWRSKLERNVQRDAETDRDLRAQGWAVLRFWEHEIDENAEDCAQRVAKAIADIRASQSGK